MKWIKRLALALAALFALCVLALVLLPFFVDLDALANKYKDEALVGVGEQLGRPVTMGPFRVKVWSGLEARAEGLRIGPAKGAPADAAPLLEVKEVFVDLALLDAVLSLGRTVRVEEVAVRGLAVHVERAADCRMSFQDILDTMASKPAAPEEPAKPMDPEVLERLRGASIGRLALEGASATFVDHAVGVVCPPPPADAVAPGEAPPAAAAPRDATVTIRDLGVELRELRLGAPVKVLVTAALLGAQQNFELEAETSALPTTFPFPPGEPAPLRAHVKLGGVPLAPVAVYLPADAPLVLTPSSPTALVADLELGGLRRGPEDWLSVDGSLGLRALQLTAPAPVPPPPAGKAAAAPAAPPPPLVGEAFDVTLTPKLVATWDFTDVTLAPLGVALGPFALSLAAHARGVGTPTLQLDNVKFDAQQLDIGKLADLLPMVRSALPAGAKLGGAFGVTVETTATLARKGDPPAFTPDRATAKVTFNGDALDLLLPRQLVKPAGTPLNLALDASVEGTLFDLRELQVHFGSITLDGKGKVSSYDAPDRVLDLVVKTNTFTVDSVARLVPAVRDAVPPDTKIGGKGGLEASFKGNAERLDLDAKLRFEAVDLRSPAATLTGDATATFEVKGSPAAATVTALVDLDAATVTVPDTLDKPAGVPLHFKAQGSKRGDNLDLPTLELVLAATKIVASAKGTLPSGPFSAKFDTGTLDLDALGAHLAALRTLPPSLKGAKVLVRGEGSGRSDDATTQSIHVTRLEFTAGKSSLVASAKVDNPVAPRITFDVKSPYLDIDQLSPPSDEESPPPEPGARLLPDIAYETVATGSITVAKGIVRKVAFEDFAFDVSFDRGQLELRTMKLKVYGGGVSLGGTTADLREADPKFKLAARLDALDAQRVFSENTSLGDAIQGRLSANLDLAGVGAAWEPISKSLAGTLGGAIANGKVKGLDLAGGVGGPLVKALPMASKYTGGRVPSKPETSFQRLAGQFSLKNGGMETTEPIKVDTPAGALGVTGRIGLDQSLGLTGTLQVPGAFVSLLTGGHLKPKGPVPVGLKIGGTVTDPKVESVEVGDAVKALVGDQARALAEEAINKARAEAEAKLAEERAKAEAAANAARAEGERKAREAADKAKKAADEAAAKARAAADEAAAKAKKAADEAAAKAKDAAKDKAKDAAKDARKKLGF